MFDAIVVEAEIATFLAVIMTEASVKADMNVGVEICMTDALVVEIDDKYCVAV